jgi:hypothetical protein
MALFAMAGRARQVKGLTAADKATIKLKKVVAEVAVLVVLVLILQKPPEMAVLAYPLQFLVRL